MIDGPKGPAITLLYEKGARMNIQPSRKQTRTYINKEEYFAFQDEQNTQSFIGENLKIWAEEAISKRIQELSALEAKGFVYLGEKNWLQGYLNSGKPKDKTQYDSWVYSNFIEYLKLNFKVDETYPDVSKVVWKTKIAAKDYCLNFKQLANPAYYEVDKLDLYVLGDSNQPYPSHLCLLFEALHNLEYTISTLNPDNEGYDPLEITEIEVTNIVNPVRYLLTVVSEYGSEFNKAVVLGRAWRDA